MPPHSLVPFTLMHSNQRSLCHLHQVHYGRASLAAVSQLPCYFVYPRLHISTAAVATALSQLLQPLPQPDSHAATASAACDQPPKQQQQQQQQVFGAPAYSSKRGCLVLVDQPYQHCLPGLQGAVAQAFEVRRDAPWETVASSAPFCTTS